VYNKVVNFWLCSRFALHETSYTITLPSEEVTVLLASVVLVSAGVFAHEERSGIRLIVLF